MRAPYVLAGLVALLAAGAVSAPAAHAAIPFAPCTPAGFQCGQLAVPLDPAGAVGGTLTLNVKRRVAASNPSNSAVVGLAGGPGQAAIPFASKLAQNMAPALATRDLLVFDQRGTGSSGELRCSGQSTAAQCAAAIGPSRAFYRTAESVDDIEAIRQAAGYAKLVIYGTSYGTKVAEAYAAKYPQNVEALVLDPVVTPNGRTVRRSLGPVELLDILLAGDFNPTLRADFPAAVRSALRGDVRPILRLQERTALDDSDEDDDISVALFAATTCEEGSFPWERSAAPRARADAA